MNVRLLARRRAAWIREFLEVLYVQLTSGVPNVLILRRWKTAMPELVEMEFGSGPAEVVSGRGRL